MEKLHLVYPTLFPAQIEGGFVMGIGNVTTEELVYDDNGRLQNDGTWEYKPPCSKTIPQVQYYLFHVCATVTCLYVSTV